MICIDVTIKRGAIVQVFCIIVTMGVCEYLFRHNHNKESNGDILRVDHNNFIPSYFHFYHIWIPTKVRGVDCPCRDDFCVYAATLEYAGSPCRIWYVTILSMNNPSNAKYILRRYTWLALQCSIPARHG